MLLRSLKNSIVNAGKGSICVVILISLQKKTAFETAAGVAAVSAISYLSKRALKGNVRDTVSYISPISALSH